MYLIFPSEESAIERADEEGKEIGFSYWTNGVGTRWLSEPAPTIDGLWALDVSEYNLDDSEKSATVDSYTPMPEEEE